MPLEGKPCRPNPLVQLLPVNPVVVVAFVAHMNLAPALPAPPPPAASVVDAVSVKELVVKVLAREGYAVSPNKDVVTE